ncbi:unnamed protein product, partial [Meganyctiphanes norvegica]
MYNEKLDFLNEEEMAYVGMNKQESRIARGAIEKVIHISAYIIANIIVFFRSILVVIFIFGTAAKCSNDHFDIIVGSPEPTSEQYKDTYLVITDTLSDIVTFKKEEEIYSTFLYCNFCIMDFMKMIRRATDFIQFCNIIIMFSYWITPLMRHTLHQIYETYRIRKASKFETFGDYIIRICGRSYRYSFKLPRDRDKIRAYDKFDVTLTNKLIDKCVAYHLDNDPFISVHNYEKIKLVCSNIKDIRNYYLHNLPECDIDVYGNYSIVLNDLETHVNTLVSLLKAQFPTSNIDILTK